MGFDMVRGEVRLRRAEKADLPEILEIERAIFSVPWSENGFLFEIDSPESHFTLAEADGRIAGFIIIHRSYDEAEIYNVAVREEYRRLGIADMLMQDARMYAALWSVQRVFLEVRQSNVPARALYKKHGFEVLGVRKKYYDEPKEDAILMELEMKNE